MQSLDPILRSSILAVIIILLTFMATEWIINKSIFLYKRYIGAGTRDFISRILITLLSGVIASIMTIYMLAKTTHIWG